MWTDLPSQWQECLELSWDSYCEGSVPIAAVICDREGRIISSGRNRLQGISSPSMNQIVGGRLAHAEVNALLGLAELEADPHELELFTTVEPCPLCIGAICMSNLKVVRYASRDAWSGSTDLLDASPYLRWKAIKAIPPEIPLLESIIHIFQVDSQLNSSHPRASDVLAKWESVYPGDVHLGRRVHQDGILKRSEEARKEVREVVEVLVKFVHETGTLNESA